MQEEGGGERGRELAREMGLDDRCGRDGGRRRTKARKGTMHEMPRRMSSEVLGRSAAVREEKRDMVAKGGGGEECELGLKRRDGLAGEKGESSAAR